MTWRRRTWSDFCATRTARHLRTSESLARQCKRSSLIPCGRTGYGAQGRARRISADRHALRAGKCGHLLNRSGQSAKNLRRMNGLRQFRSKCLVAQTFDKMAHLSRVSVRKRAGAGKGPRRIAKHKERCYSKQRSVNTALIAEYFQCWA